MAKEEMPDFLKKAESHDALPEDAKESFDKARDGSFTYKGVSEADWSRAYDKAGSGMGVRRIDAAEEIAVLENFARDRGLKMETSSGEGKVAEIILTGKMPNGEPFELKATANLGQKDAYGSDISTPEKLLDYINRGTFSAKHANKEMMSVNGKIGDFSLESSDSLEMLSSLAGLMSKLKEDESKFINRVPKDEIEAKIAEIKKREAVKKNVRELFREIQHIGY